MRLFSKTPRRLRRLGQIALLLSLLSGLLLGAPTPALRAQAQTSGPLYVVQPGDTLYSIALSFGITVDALQAANPSINANALGVGQSVLIPGFDGLTGTLTTQALAPGETVDSLGVRLGLQR